MDISSTIDVSSLINNANPQAVSTKTAEAAQQFQQYLDADGAAKAGLTQAEIDKIDKTATEFEAVFISNMVEQMFSDVELEKPFGGGSSENIYRSMMISKYAENMAAGDGIGIASQLKDNMYKMQLGK